MTVGLKAFDYLREELGMEKLSAIYAALALCGCATQPPANIGYGQFAHVYSGSGNLLMQVDHPTGYECENDVKAGWHHVVEMSLKVSCSDVDESSKMAVYIDMQGQTGPVAATRIWYLDSEMCALDLPGYIKQYKNGRNGQLIPECRHP